MQQKTSKDSIRFHIQIIIAYNGRVLFGQVKGLVGEEFGEVEGLVRLRVW